MIGVVGYTKFNYVPDDSALNNVHKPIVTIEFRKELRLNVDRESKNDFRSIALIFEPIVINDRPTSVLEW